MPAIATCASRLTRRRATTRATSQSARARQRDLAAREPPGAGIDGELRVGLRPTTDAALSDAAKEAERTALPASRASAATRASAAAGEASPTRRESSG